MKGIDPNEIRSTMRRMERDGLTVDSSAAERGAELVRNKELTDAEVDLLWEMLDDDPPREADGVREPRRPAPSSDAGETDEEFERAMEFLQAVADEEAM